MDAHVAALIAQRAATTAPTQGPVPDDIAAATHAYPTPSKQVWPTPSEQVWLLEHPPLYTAGPRAKPTDFVSPARFPVHQTRRGGELTYHGPGQRVVYVMLDLRTRTRDVRLFVRTLEAWIIDALATFGLRGEPRAGRAGVWIARSEGRDDKIAALGVQIRSWVSAHGIAINVAPDLTHFDAIVPCGIRDHGITRLRDLVPAVTMSDVDRALRSAFETHFGPTFDASAPLGRPTFASGGSA
ncbi:MAG: lipoyl(octanoyl) transferase LipB [Pseudomonadota bacterium]